MVTTCRFTAESTQTGTQQHIFCGHRPFVAESAETTAGTGLTVSLGSFTSQQLARSLRLEVAAGDALTVTAVQHFLVPVLLHLLKSHEREAVSQRFCV